MTHKHNSISKTRETDVHMELDAERSRGVFSHLTSHAISARSCPTSSPAQHQLSMTLSPLANSNSSTPLSVRCTLFRDSPCGDDP